MIDLSLSRSNPTRKARQYVPSMPKGMEPRSSKASGGVIPRKKAGCQYQKRKTQSAEAKTDPRRPQKMTEGNHSTGDCVRSADQIMMGISPPIPPTRMPQLNTIMERHNWPRPAG